MEILRKNFIGSGAHWDVNELVLSPPGYLADRIEYLTVAQKVSTNKSGRISDNIDAYRKVKQSGLPTLAFYEAATIGTDDCIICENLSLRVRHYASPNTARAFPTTEDLLLKALRTGKSLEQVKAEEKPPSILESALKANPVRKIIDIEKFLDVVSAACVLATKSGIGLCEDMFFFGTNRTEETDLDFLICDFDTLIDLEDEKSEEIQLKNTLVGISALYEFLDQFVEDGDSKDKYISLVEERAVELQDEIEGFA